MSSLRERLTSVLCCMSGLCLACCTTPGRAQPPASAKYAGIGRAATPQEVAAWDTDVRPDFKGLPKGAGSVAQGQVVWEAQCASCHGVFGESNAMFAPLVGGTTAADMKTGHAARLNDPAFPGRSTLMKLSSVSTLWDYIHRAMPWNAPKSLSTEQVYAVTAYLLHLGGVLPEPFVLSNSNIADVQQLLPNRNGSSTAHGLWPGKRLGNSGQPDVKAVACMKNCVPEPKVASFVPDFARNDHGNLALQQRSVGPQRGIDTSGPAASGTASGMAAGTAAGIAASSAADPAQTHARALALAQKHNCLACHGVDRAIVGPALREVAARYAQRQDAAHYLAGKIKAGGQGAWGSMAMPPQTLTEEDTETLARWLAAGAPDR